MGWLLVSPRAYTAAFADLIAKVVTTPLEEHCMSSHDDPVNYIACQEPLPGPREPLDLDAGLGDAELFEAAFLHSPSDGYEQLGDPWADVARLILSGMLVS